MHRLTIAVLSPEASFWKQFEVRFLINGVDVLEEVFDGGPNGDPDGLLGPNSPLLPTDQTVGVRIAEASCVPECCGAVDVQVSVDGDQVVWNGWHNPEIGDAGLGEYRFDRADYLAEFARADRERGWESPGREVARLLRDALTADPSVLATWNSTVHWTYCRPWTPGQVELAMNHDRPDPTIRTGMSTLSVPVTDASPAIQVERIMTWLRRVDPRPLSRIPDRALTGRTRWFRR